MSGMNIVNFAGPSRLVPFLVKLRVLFGGFINQAGWFIIGFSLMFVWTFTAKMNLKDWSALRGEVESSRGVVTKVERHESGSGVRRYAKYRHYYSFTGSDGNEYKGYSTSRRSGRVGEKVKIIYLVGRAEVSCIKGMRSNVVGPEGFFPLLFLALGLKFVISGLRKGIRANRLLACGELAGGRLKSKVKTGREINKKPVYKLTFEFNTNSGMSCEVVTKTHLVEELEDETEEPLLYDPVCPGDAVMLDDLPGRPGIDETGNIRNIALSEVWGCLVMPIISIIGHGVYACMRFLS